MTILLLAACGQQSTIPQENLVEETTDSTLIPTSIDRGRTDDLVIGVPNESIVNIEQAGAVNILFGNTGENSGLTAVGNEFWNQDSPEIKGRSEESEYFGSALAIGDFDGNGRDDLAVGVYGESLSSISDRQHGAVNVLYGFRNGLRARDNQIWTQNTRGIKDTAEESDRFGAVLAVGDFNNDLIDDLAISATGESIGSIISGAVHILYGSNTGLTARGDQLWHQGKIGLTSNESGDRFGRALAVGDFNEDGTDDLAIGIPNKNVNRFSSAGAVIILNGSPSGLSEIGSTLWHQDSIDVQDQAETLDQFGSALTADDFNGDLIDDLAIGVPSEDLNVNVATNGGIVQVLYGSEGGITAKSSTVLNQLFIERNDRFGQVLTSGDYDGDGFYDLVAGSPNEKVNGQSQAGMVTVFYGSVDGVKNTGVNVRRVFYQSIPSMLDVSESGDRFGNALTSGDFDGDFIDDLAIGIPFEEVDGFADAGAVSLLYGSFDGLTTIDSEFWHQGIDNVLDNLEAGDRFGFALAARK